MQWELSGPFMHMRDVFLWTTTYEIRLIKIESKFCNWIPIKHHIMQNSQLIANLLCWPILTSNLSPNLTLSFEMAAAFNYLSTRFKSHLVSMGGMIWPTVPSGMTAWMANNHKRNGSDIEWYIYQMWIISWTLVHICCNIVLRLGNGGRVGWRLI